jgi:hypothetical protein
MLLLILFRKKFEIYKYGIQFTNLFLIYLIIYYYLGQFGEISTRLQYYGNISLIVIFPFIINLFSIPRNRITIFFIIAGYIFLLNRAIFFENTGASAYNPYQNYPIYKALNIKGNSAERSAVGNKFVEELIKKRNR